MKLTGMNLIGGKTSALGPQSFQAVNPATGHSLDTNFAVATHAQADQALTLATQAETEYRRRPPQKIAAFLEDIAEQILKLGDTLVERAVAETALPAARIVGERARTINQLKMFAELVREGSWVDARIDTAIPDRQPLPKPDLRQMLIGIGPVAVFGATNFPLAFSVAGGDTASALAAGNPVIVKANGSHPGTSELVGRAIQQAAQNHDLPPGVFALLHGPGRDVGMYLVGNQVIKAVGFTGSLRGGCALMQAAAQRPDPIPVYAEMSSLNPVFVLPGILREDTEALASTLAASVNLGVGQFCTKPGVIVALAGAALDRLVEALARRMTQTPPGTMLNAGMQKSYNDCYQDFTGLDGVRLVAQSSAAAVAEHTQVASTLWFTDAATFMKSRRLSEEMFGPATLIVACDSLEQMLTLARSLNGQLTATIHAAQAELEQTQALSAVLQTKAGRLLYGGVPTGVEVCPSMIHGGPYPATADSHFTSVGTKAILRFARPVCFQNYPQSALPPELRNENPRGLWRLINGRFTRDPVIVP